ncbi:MAG: Hsp20 family protein [Azospirillaceae bacterium]
MRTYDLSPLFRSTVGFDRMSRVLDAALNADENAVGYPPYNIEKTGEDTYRIVMAVAGFGEDDLEIVSNENTVVIKGRARQDEDGVTYLHRGIAGRAFERRFQLADYVNVQGAELKNGLLFIELKREVPEALKPRTIAINGRADGAKALEHEKAA